MSPNPLQNQILSLLPAPDLERLEPFLERVDLSLDSVIYEAGEPVRYVYFPVGCLVSLVSSVDHSAMEFGLVGNEGMVGFPALLGGESTISRAVVQVAGSAYKIKVAHLKAEFDRCGVLYKLLLLYIQWLLTRTIQNGACLAHHNIEPRLARWILSIQDRLQRNDLQLTQQYIAKLLGIRRATISKAAGHLQQSGLIHYRRGSITILDRPGLEDRACECYAQLQKEQQRLQALATALH